VDNHFGGIGISNLARRARSLATGTGLGPILVRAVAGSGAVQFAAMAATFLVGIQLARGLGVEGYGQYGIAMAVISLASIPGEFGIPKLMIREASSAVAHKDWSHFASVLRWCDATCLKITLVMAALVIAGALLVSRGVFTPLVAAIVLGAPVIPLFALAKLKGIALRVLDFIVLGQIAPVLLRPIILSLLLFAIFIAGERLNPAYAMAINSLTAAVALVVGYWFLRSRMPRPERVYPLENGRRLIASSIPMAMSDAMSVLQPQLALLLLGAMTSATDVGLFRIAVSISVMLILPAAIIETVATPIIARLHAQGDRRRLQHLLTRSAQAQLLGVLLLAVPLLIAAEPVLGAVFGSGFRDAAGVLRLLLVGQIANSAFGLNAALLNMTHHERRVTRAMVYSMLVNVASIALLVPWYGRMGAGAASVLALLVWNALTWIDAKRLVGYDTAAAGFWVRR
jgi:O-antigen/teichoic acid export membrane protein